MRSTNSKRTKKTRTNRDLTTQILITAKSYGVPFFDEVVADEFASNVLSNAPQEYALDAFIRLAAESMPRPSDVIRLARELAAERRKFPPVQRFLVFGYKSARTGLYYEAVRELTAADEARAALRPGETYVDEITVGGDKYARWKAEWEAMSPEEKQAAHEAEQRFKQALKAFAEAHSFPKPEEKT
jgi:hypothetical protein